MTLDDDAGKCAEATVARRSNESSKLGIGVPTYLAVLAVVRFRCLSRYGRPFKVCEEVCQGHHMDQLHEPYLNFQRVCLYISKIG